MVDDDMEMRDVPVLAGPMRAPESGAAPRRLVVLLHGVGSNGDDLIGLAPHFAQGLPDAEFLAPNAPFDCEYSPMGYQWFDIMGGEGEERLAQIRHAAGIVDSFLDTELARRGLTEADLALVGFSQGTMISLFVGLRRGSACAGILGYSGRLEALGFKPEAAAALLIGGDPVVGDELGGGGGGHSDTFLSTNVERYVMAPFGQFKGLCPRLGYPR